MKSLASQNDECTLGPEFTKKGACELQDLFKSAVHGEDGDDNKEDGSGSNSNENNSNNEDEDMGGQ